MGKPKKQTTGRRTGNRRSHFAARLARVVNGRSPVHAYISGSKAKKAAVAKKDK